MFIGWSAIFPGGLVEADINFASRAFIFISAMILDVMFISLMLGDLAEYDRLANSIAKVNNQNHGRLSL